MFELETYLIAHWKISASESKVISSYFEIEKFKAGDHYWVAGQKSLKIGLVADGILKTSVSTPADNDTAPFFTNKNHWVGNLAGFESQTSQGLVICAITDCRVANLSFSAFQKLNQQHGFFKERWAFFKRHFNAISDHSFKYDHENLRHRYEDFIRHEPDLAIELSTEDIAAYLRMPHKKLLQILFEMVLFS